MMTAQFQLTTFVFGPRNPQGRDFQVLAQSGTIEHLLPEAQGLIFDIPLLLSGWGNSGEVSALFALALGPAPSSWLLVRAALLGRSGIGVRAFGHGILIGPVADGEMPRFDRLAAKVPAPDGSQRFGTALLPVAAKDVIGEAAPALEPDYWAGLDLAWHDRVVLLPEGETWPASAEVMVQSALASVEPPAQTARIRGWSTSANMQPVARFDPQRIFSLVLASTQHAANAFPRHLPFRPGNPSNITVERPASFEEWEAFKRVLARSEDPVLSGYRPPWLATDSTLEPAKARLALLHRAGQTLDGRAMMLLISSLLRNEGASGSAERWRNAAAAMFFAMIRNATDERAAPWFLSEAANLAKPERRALFANGWSAIAAPSIALLAREAFNRLTATGLLAALPKLRGFDTYIGSAPVWQLASFVQGFGRAAAAIHLDDRQIARLLERLGENTTDHAGQELGAAIEALVAQGHARAAGLALTPPMLARLRPLSPPVRSASARALRSAMVEVNTGALATRDRLRIANTAATLLATASNCSGEGGGRP